MSPVLPKPHTIPTSGLKEVFEKRKLVISNADQRYSLIL
jgi:hypothetical protein